MIRQASPLDLPAITNVRTSVFENHLSVEQMAVLGITESNVAKDILAGELGAWVAESEGRIVAFSMARKSNGNLFALFTLPGFEGQGFGSQLLALAEEWLHSNGWKTINLYTDDNSRAKEFYLRRGFQLDQISEGSAYLSKSLPSS